MQPRRDATELQSILDSPQLIRGEIDKPGDVVPRGLPEFLAGSKQPQIDPDESGRLQLAHWIASQAQSPDGSCHRESRVGLDARTGHC